MTSTGWHGSPRQSRRHARHRGGHGHGPPGAPPGTAGSAYYEIKVRIDRHEFSGLGEDLQLFPGMPAEIYIMTGTRTFGQYFLDPLAKSFRRAFREK